ncbi:hypothetical protein W01_05920 [Candidatus Nitrotoga sp. AM1P]|nr:hypothetical protein W01_05920 [Candidatus Nitrotoga sp. AM1P]
MLESDVFTKKGVKAPGAETVPSGATRYLSNEAAVATGKALKNHTTSPTRAMLDLMRDIPPPNINWGKVKKKPHDAIS